MRKKTKEQMNKEANLYYYNVTKKNRKETKCADCGCDITDLPKTRKYCNKCLKNAQKGMRGEYKCRIIVKSKNKKPTYGITIPEELLNKYSLHGKKFKIRISPGGKFILYSQIKPKDL